MIEIKSPSQFSINSHNNVYEASSYSDHSFDDNNQSIPLSQVVIRSDFANETSERQSKIIIERFNQGIKNSAFTDSPVLGRALPRLDSSYYALCHRDKTAELFDPRGQRFGTVYSADPTTIIEYKGQVPKTCRYFTLYGKTVLNVPSGHFAKALSKNRPVIYGEGPHVIIDPTFIFDESTGIVNQQEPFINHSTINILRVPSGKVAKVWVGTQPFILESRREPYVFVDAQFKVVQQKDGQDKYFHSSSATFMEHGSIKRIIPHTGEVAITYDNGNLAIIQTPKDGKPVIIDSPTHNFEGFIQTSLQTCLFPSKETKQQAIKDNKNATTDEVNLKIFQTRDSLRVGVVLVVAFRIVDPQIALTKLGKEGIINHIENISFADMGKAIQLSTLQEIMYFNDTRPSAKIDESVQTIQDRVKAHLARDLCEFGIELARLQIETIKVLDTEIAKKLAGQSVTSAEYTTKQATLVKEYDIKTTEARLKAETDNIALEQKGKAIIAEAQAKLESAKKQAEALLVTANAQKKVQEMQGELYSKFPILAEIELAKIKSEALKSSTLYITPQDAGNFMNSPFFFMERMLGKQQTNTKS
ncbi:hypothetical protein ACTFIY_005698 [Dictyostelium cf. discoideum]